MTNRPGRVLSGRYRLIRPIGHGAQAAVWVAEHLALSTQVAVKLIDPSLAQRPDAVTRFRREATAAAALRSPHVVQIIDHGIDEEQPFIVMELLEGQDLFERLEKRDRLSLRETARIVSQVARALTKAHESGVVHRDLKPENVFLAHNVDDEIVKVLDFGVAKVKDPMRVNSQKTRQGQLLGTPQYMSPEQVKGTTDVDFKADLWALGIIAFQCVTGDLPFDSDGVGDLLLQITIGEIPTPSRVLPGLPKSFDAWFSRACARKAADRFGSAMDMARALEDLVAALPEAKATASVARPVIRKRPRSSVESMPEEVAKRPPKPAALPPRPAPPAAFTLNEDDLVADEVLAPKPPSPPMATPFPATLSTPNAAPAPAPEAPPTPHAPEPPPAPPSRPQAPTSTSQPIPAPVRSAPAALPYPTVGGLESADLPPELDGSRRRLVLKLLGVALAVFAIWVAWNAIAPQFYDPPSPAATALAPSPTPAPTPEPVPTLPAVDPLAAPSAQQAVDPAAPPPPMTAKTTTTTPAATGAPRPKPAPTAGNKGELEFVIPEPDE